MSSRSLFLNVKNSDDAQAIMAWAYFIYIDYPIGQMLYEGISNDLERNIRAGIAFGIIGTVYWYIIGLLLSLSISKIKANKSLKCALRAGRCKQRSAT